MSRNPYEKVSNDRTYRQNVHVRVAEENWDAGLVSLRSFTTLTKTKPTTTPKTFWFFVPKAIIRSIMLRLKPKCFRHVMVLLWYVKSNVLVRIASVCSSLTITATYTVLSYAQPQPLVSKLKNVSLVVADLIRTNLRRTSVNCL